MEQPLLPVNGETSSIPSEIWAKLSAESRVCIENLLDYRAPPLPDFGLVKQAAVLVALFEKPGHDGLHLVLTTRAKTLRQALPGGRVDSSDPDVVHTAHREAFEEVGLPLPPHPSIQHVTVLGPVMTILPLNAHMRNHIVVVPVVCLISDPNVIASLEPNPDEVDHIFTHPLRGCHSGRMNDRDRIGLAARGGIWWPHDGEFHSSEDRVGVRRGRDQAEHQLTRSLQTTGGYRMHRFRTTHSPIKGLTSDVLINTATIAFASPPAFTRFASNQPDFESAIATVVTELPMVIDVVGEKKVLEWGAANGTRLNSGETWHESA